MLRIAGATPNLNVMRTIWQSLIWKEFHEHKWKAASIATVLVGATSVGMFAEERDKLGLAFGLMCLCVVPLAAFIGLGIAANERGRHTLPFLQAQPVPLWQAGLVKLAMATLTLVVPILAIILWLYVWRFIFDILGIVYSKKFFEASPIGTGNHFVDCAIYCSVLAVSILIWTAATGINRRDEISAGATSLVIILVWVGILYFIRWCFGNFVGRERGVDELIIGTILALVPAGIIALISMPQEVIVPTFIFISLIVHAILATFYVCRFGQTMERPVVSPKVAVPREVCREWLGSPRESPVTAIVWKQLRESLPMAVGGLAAIVGVALFINFSNGPLQPFADTYAEVTMTLGFCIALVVGIGTVLPEVSPQLNTFWRSRPINASLWYWVKFATGLAILTATIIAPFVLITSVGSHSHRMLQGAAVVVAVCFAIYSAAMLMTLIVRHAVYAAILSLGLLTLYVGLAWVAWMTPRWLGWVNVPDYEERLSNGSVGWSVVLMIAVVACFVISALLGWLAMRNDWGVKSRF